MKIPLKQPYRQFFGTLANQVRLEIIEHLSQGRCNVTGIVDCLDYDQSTISHSLRRLEECGFVSVEQQGKERIYSLNTETIRPLMDLMNSHMDKHCSHVVAKREDKKCH